MNIPECQHYKDAYDTCYREKVSSQISKLIFTSTTASACDDPFQVFRFLVFTFRLNKFSVGIVIQGLCRNCHEKANRRIKETEN